MSVSVGMTGEYWTGPRTCFRVSHQFHTCNADPTRSRVLWLWVRHADLPDKALRPIRPFEPGVCHQRRTLPCGAGLQAAALHRWGLFLAQPSVPMMPRCHHLTTHHHGTTMAPPVHYYHRSTKNAYSNHHALTPGSLRFSPIRPDEQRRHHLLAWT